MNLYGARELFHQTIFTLDLGAMKHLSYAVCTAHE